MDRALYRKYGKYAEACPAGAIALAEQDRATVKVSLCSGCGACVGECPMGAVRLGARGHGRRRPSRRRTRSHRGSHNEQADPVNQSGDGEDRLTLCAHERINRGD